MTQLFFRILASSVISITLFGVAQVFAHAELESSNPAAGETVQTLPNIELTFNEPVYNPSIFLLGDSVQYPLQFESPQTPQTTLIGTPNIDLSAGIYQVVWAVNSDDDHVISGSYQFEYVPVTDDNNTLIIGGTIVAILLAMSLIAGVMWMRQS